MLLIEADDLGPPYESAASDIVAAFTKSRHFDNALPVHPLWRLKRDGNSKFDTADELLMQ
jgi:hypothetical protein